MHYNISIVIDKPLKDVIALFEDPDNLSEWQLGLVSMEHVSGTPGEVGAVSKMIFNESGRKVEMTETILEYNLPDRFVAQYEASGVHNLNVNHFEAVSDNQTRWDMETTFTFSGFMRIMALFLGGAFKNQTQKTMAAFKSFAERS